MTIADSQNLADYRLTLEGRDLGLAPPEPLPGFPAAFSQALMDSIGPRLISLTLTEKRGGEADELKLSIHDHDGRMEIPKEGAVLSLQLGWKRGRDVPIGLVNKGRFKVDEASWSGPPDIIEITARSADFLADFTTRREIAATETTIGEFLAKVAEVAGLAPRVSAKLADLVVTVIDQDQASDMATLRRLGEIHDAVATVKNGVLIFAPIGEATSLSGAALSSMTLTRRDGDRYSYRRAGREDHDGAEARWHDKQTGERKSVTTGGNNPRRLGKIYHSEESARQATDAAERKNMRSKASFEYDLALARPDLAVETPIALSGFKAEPDALDWVVAECEHELSSSGLGTKLKLERR